MKNRNTEQHKQNKQEKRRLHTWVVTVLSLALVSVVGFLAWLQLSNYEKGVLEVYADQQDGYVQLVLDQINLSQERSDEEIIENILGTLDASGNRYWTFSRKESLIFVRDVLETNRYKGFTTSTYFYSDSARDFLLRLNDSRVLHDTILIEETPYIASGVEFAYGGEDYKICLLTNAETVLDYNAYLNAKINLMVLAFVLLGIVVISLIVLALLAERYRKQFWRERDDNRVLRKKIEALNEKLKRGDLYDTGCTAFREGAVPIILRKLKERRAWPFSLYAFYTKRPAVEFLEEFKPKESDRMLRVLTGEHEFLLFLLEGGAGLEEEFLHGEEDGFKLLGKLCVEKKPETSLEQMYEEFVQGIRNDGKSVTA